MLLSVESILGYQVSSRNGIAGTVTDILFANNLRSVRGLAVLTGSWLVRREVLVPMERVIELVPNCVS
jgi:sporulation protein YlmC with PRC-barrel domain